MPMAGLTMQSLRAHKALIPLFVSIGGGCVLAGGYLARLCLYNPDCSWNRSSNPHPWQKLKPTDRYKFYSTMPYSSIPQPKNRPDI